MRDCHPESSHNHHAYIIFQYLNNPLGRFYDSFMGKQINFFDLDNNMKFSAFCFSNYSMVLDNLQGFGQALFL